VLPFQNLLSGYPSSMEWQSGIMAKVKAYWTGNRGKSVKTVPN